MPEEMDQFETDQFDGTSAADVSAVESAPVATSVPEGPLKNWFIIHTYSGF